MKPPFPTPPRRRPRPSLLLSWLWALWLLGLPWMVHTAQAAPQAWRQAEVLEAGIPARQVTLPDAWERSAPQRQGRVSYHLRLPAQALAGTQPSLFVPRVANAWRVHLNGQLVLDTGVERQPLPSLGRAPQLVALPPALVRPGWNDLLIEVAGDAHREAGLATPWTGDRFELLPMYGRAALLQAHGPSLLASAGLTMGVLGLLVAWRTRQAAYGWFGAGNLIWGARLTLMGLGIAGPWALALQVLFELLHSLLVASLVMFMLTLASRDTPRARQVVGAFLAVQAALVLGHAFVHWPMLRTANLLLAMLFAAGAAGWLGHLAWKTRSTLMAGLSLAGLAAAGIGLRDWVVLRVLFDFEAITWTRYFILALMAAMAWRLVGDYARSLKLQQHQTRELQAALAAREQELQQAYEARRALDRRQAAAEERDRLLRDMHDGLGGRLVSALALVHLPDAKVAEPATLQELRLTLDDCLTELRITLDSLEVEERSLGESLAEMRFRLEPSLRAAGIRLVWNVEDAALDTTLSPGATLQVLRIVREACTNVVKHAQASVVWLTLRRVGNDIELIVLDNGMLQRSTPGHRKLMPAHSGKRGLASMTRRAEALQGRIEIGPHPEGWQVALRFPVERARAAG